MVGHQQLSEVYPLWELFQLHIVLYPALSQQTSIFPFGVIMGNQWFYSVSPGEKEARKEEVKKMFLAADKDGDGKLSKEEWLEGKV